MNNKSQGDIDMTVNRTANIEWLVANCDCWKGDKDAKEVLNEMTDDKLVKLRAAGEKVIQLEAVANAARKGFFSDSPEMTLNAMPAALAKAAKAKEDAKDGGKDDEEEDDAGKKVTNKETKVTNEKKPITANEWLESAPVEIQSAVRNAMEIEKRERVALVQRLTVNVADQDKRKTLQTKFLTKPLDELRDMVSLLPAPTGNKNKVSDDPIANYLGQAGFMGQQAQANNEQSEEDKNDILPIVTTNWAEEASKERQVRSRQG